MPTSNIIGLAADGFKYAKLIKRGTFAGQYEGLPGKQHSTHKIHAIWARPRIVPAKHCPVGVVRCIYHDESKPIDFTGEDRHVQAQAWVDSRKEIAKNACPYSAVTVPRGRSYKNFVAERAKAAADGSLYDKQKPTKNMAKKAPKLPGKKAAANKDSKNGITRPKDGTTTGKVWDIADAAGADRQAVIKEGLKRKIALATITTQYGKWRKYKGMTGRTAAPKKAPAKKKPALPKKKAAPAPAPTPVTS